MKFSKYIAAGNDFLVFDNRDHKIEKISELALKYCDRHFGLGADGILLVEESHISDIKMRYFNSDGSEGEMCGNGIRSFTKYIFDNNIITKDTIRIETLAGIKTVEVKSTDNVLEEVRVNMGFGEFNPELIPINSDKNYIIDEKLDIDEVIYNFSAVLVGVPHVVIFVSNIEEIDINDLGKKIENHEIFPKKTNVNFVEVESRNKINIYTWERGAGRTLGCGTGSCSSVLIGNKLKLLDREVEVKTEGGRLKVQLESSDEIFMIGSADLIAVGELL